MAAKEELTSGVLFGREFTTAVVLFQEALAAKLGLNATDYRCLELIMRKNPMTAKALSEEANLTTGAITGIIDHLEKAGYVQRLTNPRDRRSIIINPCITQKELHTKLGDNIESYRKAMTEIFKKYNTNQTAAIVDFLSRFLQILKDQTSELQKA